MMRLKTILKITGSSISAALAVFLVYAQFLQSIPPSAKRFWLILGGAFALVFSAVYLLLQLVERTKAGNQFKLELIIPVAAVMALFLILILPEAPKGLLETHTLQILPDEQTNMENQLMLTWFTNEFGEVRFEKMLSVDGWAKTADGLVLKTPGAALRWQGKPGKTATLEFMAGPDNGVVFIIWDGVREAVSLYHPEAEKRSYQFSFPPADELPVFIIWFLFLSGAGMVVIYLLLVLAARNRPNVVLVAIWTTFVLFRLFQFSQSDAVLTMVDTASYAAQSAFSYTEIILGKQVCYTPDFCIGRPFLVPLVFKMLKTNPLLISLFQFSLSIICWSFLAFAAFKTFKGFWLQIFSAVALLGLGSIPNVTRWDRAMLSESITISIVVLFIAGWVWMTRRTDWSAADTALFLFSALLFAGTRDSAVWVLILLISLLMLAALRGINRKKALISAAAVSIICIYALSVTGDRWKYPLSNVFFTRLLDDPQAVAYLERADIPGFEELIKLRGETHLYGTVSFTAGMTGTQFFDWLSGDGKRTYLGYLLKTAFSTFRAPWYEVYEREAFEQTGFMSYDTPVLNRCCRRHWQSSFH